MIAIAKLVAAVKLVATAGLLAAVVATPTLTATVAVVRAPLAASDTLYLAPAYVAPSEDSAGWNCNEQGNRRCYAGAHVQAQS